ncbi:MAG: ABC transporter permease subunit, partial [Microbacterium sp.]
MTALTDAAPARVYKAHAKPAWRRVLLTRESAIIAILLLVIIGALSMVENFDSPLTVTYLLRDIAPILLIALPMTLIIITEEIDLSVASIVGLSSVMTGILTQAGLPFPAA